MLPTLQGAPGIIAKPPPRVRRLCALAYLTHFMAGTGQATPRWFVRSDAVVVVAMTSEAGGPHGAQRDAQAALATGVLLGGALLLLLLLVVVVLAMDAVKPRGYPPGPAWFPVLGTFPQLRALVRSRGFLHEALAALARRHGPVLGLRLGRDRVVVASGLEAVRAVMAHPDFAARPDGFFFRLRGFGQRLGVVFTDGALWQELRRFSLCQLKHCGLGRREMEVRLATEAGELVAELRARCAGGRTAVAMDRVFDVSVLNALWAMLAGRRFALRDERLAGLLRTLHDCFRQTDSSGGLLNQLPFLRFIAPARCGYTATRRNLEALWAFIQETIAEHKQTMKPGQPRDLIDAFLDKSKEEEEADDDGGVQGGVYTEQQLVVLLLDLFMAGTDTTSNSLGFGVLLLLRHRDVQARAQAELDRVVGRDRDPSLQDRARLSYVEAVLMEVQRLCNVAPVGVPHRAVRDTVLQGHHVPKDATVLANIMSVHMDAGHWGDPDAFRPDRFLDEDGKVRPSDYFMPFGIGKRRCLGEALARSSLFLFLTHLLHRFTLSPSPEHPVGDPVADRHFLDGFTLSPKPFHALLVPRDHHP